MFTSLSKVVIRIQLNSQMKRYKGKVCVWGGVGMPSAGASVPVRLGCITLRVQTYVLASLQALQTLAFRVCMEVSLTDMMD